MFVPTRKRAKRDFAFGAAGWILAVVVTLVAAQNYEGIESAVAITLATVVISLCSGLMLLTGIYLHQNRED